MRLAHITTLLLVVLGATSCRSNSHRFYFRPSPCEVLIQEEGGPLFARALVAVPGAMRSGEGGPEMRVKLRFESKVDEPLIFDARNVLLVSSNLEPFGLPHTGGAPRIEIPPRGEVSTQLDFPFPPGMGLRARELDGVNLQWTLERGSGEVIETSVTLERMPDPTWPYDDFDNSRVFISVGYSGH